MRIAFVFDVVYPYITGGVEKRIWELSKRLVERGHDVHIYGMMYWEGADDITTEGVILHGVCKPVRLYNAAGRRSIRQVITYSLFLPMKLFKEKFDIVDCQASPYFPALVCRLYCTVKKTPLVLTWHEVWGRYWLKYMGPLGYAGWLLEKLCQHLTPNNIAVSEATKRDLDKNTVVVPNGVDVEYFKKILPSETKSDVIFIGRLIRDKNVDILIDALKLLRARRPNLLAVIVGDGPEKEALQQRVWKLDISNNVRFTGVLQSYAHVAALLKSSKVFAFPSTREGFGIVVVEANACGLPVVTVNHKQNAAAELITNGVNGYVIGLSAEELAGTIGGLLENDMLQKTLSEGARKKAQEYDWHKVVQELESIYTKTLSSQ